MRNSASEICLSSAIFCHLQKSIFAFRGRIQSRNNTIIQCMVNSVAPLVSNVWKWWRTIGSCTGRASAAGRAGPGFYDILRAGPGAGLILAGPGRARAGN